MKCIFRFTLVSENGDLLYEHKESILVGKPVEFETPIELEDGYLLWGYTVVPNLARVVEISGETS